MPAKVTYIVENIETGEKHTFHNYKDAGSFLRRSWELVRQRLEAKQSLDGNWIYKEGDEDVPRTFVVERKRWSRSPGYKIGPIRKWPNESARHYIERAEARVSINDIAAICNITTDEVKEIYEDILRSKGVGRAVRDI